MKKILLLIAVAVMGCTISHQKQAKKLTIRTTIDQRSNIVYLFKHNRFERYRGTRDQFFELIRCHCPQPADKRLMLITQYSIHTMQQTGKVLCAQSPTDRYWRRVVMFATSDTALPFQSLYINNDRITVTVKNEKRTFFFDGSRWNE